MIIIQYRIAAGRTVFKYPNFGNAYTLAATLTQLQEVDYNFRQFQLAFFDFLRARQTDTKNSSTKTHRPEYDIAKTKVMIGYFQIL